MLEFFYLYFGTVLVNLVLIYLNAKLQINLEGWEIETFVSEDIGHFNVKITGTFIPAFQFLISVLLVMELLWWLFSLITEHITKIDCSKTKWKKFLIKLLE